MVNVLVLTGLVLLPIAASIVVVSATLHRRVAYAALRRTVSLHSSEGLAKQGLFWISILVPVLLFFEFGYFVWSGSELELSQKGFQNFISMSTLPLGLLSLSIPGAALVTKLHSTAQTAKQIAIAETKNNYDLFHTHRREFAGYYEQFGPVEFLEEFKASYKVNPRLHARLFHGDSAAGIPMLRKDFIDARVADIKMARELLIKVLTCDSLDSALPDYLNFSKLVDDLFINFGVQDVRIQLASKSIKVDYLVLGERRSQRTAGTTTRQAVAAFRCAKSNLVMAMEFAGYAEGVQAVRDEEVDYIDETTGYKTIHHQQVRVIEALAKDYATQFVKREFPDLTGHM